ncbi:YqgE/AlgH family protein [Taylorella equigenitalis]|uniref:UPF0301 protein TEQUI_0418 n=2 Tax=Taylorella equigenitalis TaxID=29575 RepID=A0A654KG08_TAYEM|nr:YqgE/AlgH family protein [Taylorella equigenitalis]ADU91362.1 UPF0301 protein YqgE [Taylorella equigenitalis MCE9]AFN36456.1 putative exported protein [Taylorella equigenitalis ATCC 35865]ASY31024.1 hypothetical protein B9Z30_06655 [Taylorella equigenitalis]ASY39856.1 hypothetical protein CA604_07075 [Taylorella equigenitalis]ASY41303.1 hypothetical protein CAV20_06510 [Taylorella equigenitalis]
MALNKLALSGYFLVAMPSSGESIFDNSVVYILKHDEDGALGVVINKPSPHDLTDFVEPMNPDLDDANIHEIPKDSWGKIQEKFPESKILTGGPLGLDHILVVTEGDTMPEMLDSTEILQDYAKGTGSKRLVVFNGYSSWAPNQLEEEIVSNYWITLKGDLSLIFEVPIEDRYRKAFEFIGIEPHDLHGGSGNA